MQTKQYQDGLMFGLTHYKDDFRRHVSFLESNSKEFRMGVSDGLLIAKRELKKILKEKRANC